MKGRCVAVLATCALVGLACNDNGLLGTPQNIKVSPSTLDFGRTGTGEDFAQVITVENTGGRTLVVTGVRPEPADIGYFVAGETPTPDDPWELEPNTWKPVEVHFAPEAVGDQAADLVVESNDPDTPALPVSLLGEAFQHQNDTFTQGEQVGGMADILFVVDNSGSMSDDQQKLGDSFSTFINWITDAMVEFNIAITTTDVSDTGEQGAFVGSPKVLTNGTPNVISKFESNVAIGDDGSNQELGLEGGKLALSEPLISNGNAGFLRPEARLFLVWVSDEDDQSPDSINQYMNFFTDVKGGDPDKVFYAAIAGPPPTGCFNSYGTADSGQRYHDITTGNGGLFDTICQQNFGGTLEDLAFEVTSAEGEFFLTEVPIVDTLEMVVNGADQPPDRWQYHADTNSVRFYEDWNPVAGAEVVAEYEVAPQ